MKKNNKKKYLFWSTIVILVILFFAYIGREKQQDFNFEVVGYEDISQEVSVTGRVNPSDDIMLAFERGGTVKEVNVQVGDIVNASDVLASLDAGQLYAQLESARANYAVAKAKLLELKRGARVEEVKVAETGVVSAENSLIYYQKKLDSTIKKNEATLAQAYTSALNETKEAVNAVKSSLLDFTDIQQENYAGQGSQDSYAIEGAKNTVVEKLFSQLNAGTWTSNYISELSDGLFGFVQNLSSDGIDSIKINEVLDDTLDVLLSMQDLLETMPINNKLSSTEKTTLATEKVTITGYISTITAQKGAVAVAEATAENLYIISGANFVSAQDTLLKAQDNLLLVNSGSSAEAILAQEAQLRSAGASIALIREQIKRSVLKSPIDGVVRQQDAIVGETASAFVSVIAVISDDSFEIELFIAEADIAKVKINDRAGVTLDAYGDEELFSAVIVSIDPAEIMKQGVPTYKVVLHFEDTKNLVRSGMTANTDIVTNTRENVLTVLSRAVLGSNGDRYVRVLKNEKVLEYEEVQVETGLKSANGRIEILHGLQEGDMVVTFIEQ